MKLRGCLLAAAAIVSVKGSASAQDPAGAGTQPPVLVVPPAPPAAHGCVLHVWPAANARSSYMGWFHGGAVDGDRRGIKGYPAMHSDMLTTPVQQQLLTTVDWAHSLSAPALQVVVHDAPPPEQDDRARKTPLITDRPGCYAELLVHSVLVERAAMSSSTVRVMVIAKKWLAQGSTPDTFSVMNNERVDLAATDDKVVEASLKSGFVASIKRVISAKFFWLQ